MCGLGRYKLSKSVLSYLYLSKITRKLLSFLSINKTTCKQNIATMQYKYSRLLVARLFAAGLFSTACVYSRESERKKVGMKENSKELKLEELFYFSCVEHLVLSQILSRLKNRRSELPA